MTVKQRQHLLAYLGYYTAPVDGIWGPGSRSALDAFRRDCAEDTDDALRRAVYLAPDREEPEDFWEGIAFFTPEEVRCRCGGRYCGGFPHTVQPLLMEIADRARRWSGHPITVVSGLRCDTWNRLQGGVENSQHRFGEALDVYFRGVTPEAALAWLQSQPDVRYAYRISGCDNIHFDIYPVGR